MEVAKKLEYQDVKSKQLRDVICEFVSWRDIYVFLPTQPYGQRAISGFFIYTTSPHKSGRSSISCIVLVALV